VCALKAFAYAWMTGKFEPVMSTSTAKKIGAVRE
jgi:hypothetical protein